MTVYIYFVSANFSKRDDIVILREVVRFAGLYFDKAKCHYVYALRDLSACGASVCCMLLSVPFLDSHWVRGAVHLQGRIWTLSITVKPQAGIGYDPPPPGGFLYSKVVGVLVISVRV